MHFIFFFIKIVIEFIECDAMPIPTYFGTHAERNVFLVGALILTSGLAIISGCICCNRRKKGFEEFTNEIGTLEVNKTEYPILRTLSGDNEQNDVNSSVAPNTFERNIGIPVIDSQSIPIPSSIIVSLPSVNIRNDIRLTDDLNNNGPISSTDLENIENNNAENYIPNQNEIHIRMPQIPTYNRSDSFEQHQVQLENHENLQNSSVITPLHYFELPSQNHQEIFNDKQNINDDNIVKNFIQPIINNLDEANKSSHKNVRNDGLKKDNSEECYTKSKTTNVQENVPILHDYFSQDIKDEKNNANLLENYNIRNNKGNNINNKNISNKVLTEELQNDSTLSFKTNVGSNLKESELKSSNFTYFKDDNRDINVSENESENDNENENESENENENEYENENENENDNDNDNEKSVAEALRALDFAITGEEEDEYSDRQTTEDDKDGYKNLITDLLKCNRSNMNLQYIFIPPPPTSSPPPIQDDFVSIENISNKSTEDFDKKFLSVEINEIQEKAIEFVEDILNESVKVVEEKCNTKEYITFNLQNNTQSMLSTDNRTSQNFDENVFVKNETTDLLQLTKNEMKNEISPANSLDNFFADDCLPSTSTPCIKNKYGSLNLIPKNELKKNLFEDCQNGNPIFSTDFVLLKNNNDQNIQDETYIANGTFNVTEQGDALNGTYNINNKTFNANNSLVMETEIHPGDPCTSKQSMERDKFLKPLIKFQREEVTSEELNTITPVNTPIELNYNQEAWDKITKQAECEDDLKSGWFLHPQQGCEGELKEVEVDQTFDIDNVAEEDEEDSRNLESTFEALRKHLAEVLPQPQGLAGPADYSDDENDQENNRTFDEYRSPLDGLFGLLEIEPPEQATPAASNEMVINYKRPLSPILEESEEETCKTFILNETKCIDSTSTGCIGTGEAIMGVTKTLMASNDTLFNFEDTLGDKEDMLSPRLPSRNDSQEATPIKTLEERSSSITSISSSDTEKPELESHCIYLESPILRNCNNIQHTKIQVSDEILRPAPPKSLNFIESKELKSDDFYSPDQQKTFSEGTATTSSTTTTERSDISPTTLDNEATYTLNDENPSCITVIIKDDERISEISEPEWISSATDQNHENFNMQNEIDTTNSLTDIPSLDFNVNAFDKEFSDLQIISKSNEINEQIGLQELKETNSMIIHCKDYFHDDSGNSTQTSDEKSNNTSDISIDDTSKVENYDNSDMNIENKEMIDKDTENCTKKFLENEIKFSSSLKQPIIISNANDMLSLKENSNPNAKLVKDTIHVNNLTMQSSEKKIAKINEQNGFLSELEKQHQHKATDLSLIHLPNQHITSNTNFEIGVQNIDDLILSKVDQQFLVNEEIIINRLSGEEDPWAETMQDIKLSDPGSTDMLSTSFNTSNSSEWESDDSNESSEEFMYVRGNASNHNEKMIRYIKENICEGTEDGCDDFNFEKVNNINYDEEHIEKSMSEQSDNESEEFVPSCWNASAVPVKSAIKSPDKSSSSEEELKDDKKRRRSVAFKKQRYYSVYEYPKENISISPAYSEPNLWISKGTDTVEDTIDELNDGFIVSSSTRPFYGSQFNAFCHTWPGDADFSWSQLEGNEHFDKSDKKMHFYSENDLKWNKLYSNDEIDFSDIRSVESNGRPDSDSGVGESAEIFSNIHSLGELKSSKKKLRLPIEEICVMKKPNQNNDDIEPGLLTKDSDTKIILPTPLYNTDSMDSLSSSSTNSIESHQQQQQQQPKLSFSTFGKRNNAESPNQNENISQNMKYENIQNLTKPAINIILIDEINQDYNSINENIDEKYISSNLQKTIPEKIKQNDSTDEDSGIESINKITKEIN